MERISLEQAKNFIPITEDFVDSQIKYFTLTPDPLNPKWELVTYYTGRRNDLYKNRKGDGDSWIYILTNPSFPNLLKIGSTSKAPDKRAKQISRATGVPLEFRVNYAFKCFNSERLEHEIHKYLSNYRVNSEREFFDIDLEEAKKVVNLLGERYV